MYAMPDADADVMKDSALAWNAGQPLYYLGVALLARLLEPKIPTDRT
jgi:hypothetical protein